jgi:hypothetical protein
MMILILAVLLPRPSSAQLVWHDDFEDGDLEDWTVNWGNFTVENGVLKVEDEPLDFFGGKIYHPSTGAVGSWSFEIGGRWWTVSFIATSIDGNGYRLVKDSNYGTAFYLVKIMNRSSERLAHYRYWGNESYHYVNITRNNDGQFEVFIDRVLTIQETDASIMTSSLFIYRATGNDSALDNVAVVTGLYTPVVFLAVLTTGIIGTVVVFMVVGWTYRRRIIVIDG